jgi:hypothetical protein
MKDPARLLDSSTTESELRLLRAGASEQPHPEALQRLAAKLGVTGTAFMTTEPAAQHAAVAKAKAVLGAKLAVTAAVVVAAGLGALWYANQPSPEASSPRAPSVAQPSVAQPSVATTAPPPAPIATPAETVEPTAADDSAATPALADEISRLDTVRKLLAANRAKPALAALRNYDREHPSGALRQEATLLRIEALHRAGDRERARTLAERFLAEHPDSPHAPRIRALTIEGDALHAR